MQALIDSIKQPLEVNEVVYTRTTKEGKLTHELGLKLYDDKSSHHKVFCSKDGDEIELYNNSLTGKWKNVTLYQSLDGGTLLFPITIRRNDRDNCSTFLANKIADNIISLTLHTNLDAAITHSNI